MSKILYLCDRRKCENCKPPCAHTTDISHAVNFEKKDDLWIEKKLEGNVVDVSSMVKEE